MSFSIKLNKSKSISFRVSPTNSSITFALTIPRITFSLRVKRIKKKSINMKHSSGTSYKPVNTLAISSLQPIEYDPYIKKLSRLIRLNTLSNLLIPSLLLSLLVNIPTKSIDPNSIISSLITLLLILIGITGLAIKIYLHTAARLKYDLLSNEKVLPSIWRCIASSDKVWQVAGIYELDENASKKNGGIGHIYERILVKIRYKAPYYIDTNSEVLQVKLDDYSLVVLPEHYIIRKRSMIGIIDTSNIMITRETSPYAEQEDLPKDAEVLYHTWRYVNKDGSKDKRYKDNKEIPICNYGLTHLELDTGYKILLLSSKYQ